MLSDAIDHAFFINTFLGPVFIAAGVGPCQNVRPPSPYARLLSHGLWTSSSVVVSMSALIGFFVRLPFPFISKPSVAMNSSVPGLPLDSWTIFLSDTLHDLTSLHFQTRYPYNKNHHSLLVQSFLSRRTYLGTYYP